MPNHLSWHDMSSDSEYDYKNFPAHIAYMNAWETTSITSGGLGLASPLPVDINETIGPNHYVAPGAIAWMLGMLDYGGVLGACKSCFMVDPVYGGSYDCNLDDLNAILTPGGEGITPRSAYWAWNGYANVTGGLVAVNPSSSVGGIAGYDPSTKTANILLGRDTGTAGSVDVQLNNMNDVPYLVHNNQVKVRARHITDSEFEEMAQVPVDVINTTATVSGNSLTVTLPSFGTSDAYTIQVTPPRQAMTMPRTSLLPPTPTAAGATGGGIPAPARLPRGTRLLRTATDLSRGTTNPEG